MIVHIDHDAPVDHLPSGRARPVAAVLAALAAIALFASCAGGAAKPTPEARPGSSGRPATVTQKTKIKTVESAAAMLEKGDAAEAADKLGALAAAAPGDPELKLAQSAALVSAGKLADARTCVDEVLADNPNNLHALSMGADLARFDGDQKARRSYLDRALAVAPKDPSVLTSWGEYYIDIKDWNRAESSFRNALTASPRSADASLGLGRALYRQGKYAEAETQLTKAIELEPASPLAYSDRSKARYQQGKYAEAETDLDTAISKAPDEAWLYIDRGRFRLDKEEFAGAESDFARAIVLEPDYFLPYALRGGIYEESGKDEAALADYRKVIALYPDYWYAFESAGATAFRLGLWAESAADFKRAYGASRQRYEYAIASALALWRSGKPKDASALALSVAPTIDRDKYAIYWNILRLIQDQNDASSELEVLIQKEKHLDLKCAMLFYLSEYWICRGKTDLAVKYLDLAAEMKRDGTLEYRLIAAERKRLAAASNG
jgi:tetratricopeptide (TPR) repeat protein